MNPHPGFWHRTRRRPSFWLGLLVVCFLAWAWWDSYRNDSALWMKSGTIVRGYGTTYIEVGAGPVELGGRREPHYMNEGGYREEIAAFYNHDWAVPDSLVFFSCVGVWVGWLALSDWRRKTRGARVESC